MGNEIVITKCLKIDRRIHGFLTIVKPARYHNVEWRMPDALAQIDITVLESFVQQLFLQLLSIFLIVKRAGVEEEGLLTIAGGRLLLLRLVDCFHGIQIGQQGRD